MPELASEERIAALEAENARLLAVCQEICRLLTDSEEHSYGEIYTSAVDGLKGDDSALKAILEQARHDGRMDQVADDAMAWQRAEQTEQERDSLRAQLAEAERERDAAMAQLESDRTTIIDRVNFLDRVVKSRGWLSEGRGSYEWNDDRYREEFKSAVDAIMEAIEPFRKIGGDLTACPYTTAEVVKARMNLQQKCDQLTAQVERYREALQYEYDTSNMDRPLSDPQTIHNLLAETPEQSLAAVREQARREAEMPFRRALWGLHGHSGIYGDDGEMQCVECARYGVTDYKRDDAARVIGAAICALQEVVQRCKDEVRRAAQEEAAAIVEDTDIETCGGYERQDDGKATLRAAAKAVRELAAQPAKEPRS